MKTETILIIVAITVIAVLVAMYLYNNTKPSVPTGQTKEEIEDEGLTSPTKPNKQ